MDNLEKGNVDLMTFPKSIGGLTLSMNKHVFYLDPNIQINNDETFR